MAPVIPLRRIKLIVADALAGRFAPVEKAPPKEREFRAARSPWRIAGRELDGLARIGALKFSTRLRRNPKLRLFRVFKLFGQLKATGSSPAAYRPIAERLRLARWTRRL